MQPIWYVTGTSMYIYWRHTFLYISNFIGSPNPKSCPALDSDSYYLQIHFGLGRESASPNFDRWMCKDV